jgi:predicted nucleic-acid-binding protein
MLELEWVLRSAAKLPKAQVIKVFKALLNTKDLLFQDEAVLEQAIYLYQDAAADFAECLFLAQHTRSFSTPMLSFDKRAQRLPSVVAP